MAVDSCVRGVLVEMTSVNDAYLRPRCDVFRRYVLPVLAVIARQLDEAIVCTHPDGIGVEGRGSDGVDHSFARAGKAVLSGDGVEICRHARIFAREVRGNLIPTAAAI